MKLKEKLGKDVQELWRESDDYIDRDGDCRVSMDWSKQYNNPYICGFVAGFEKARELCAELFENSYHNPDYVGLPMEEAIKLIALDMKIMGEEEA